MNFGSDTVIGKQVRLILMDCFETLIQLTADGYVARHGIHRFIDHFSVQRRIPLIVISDAPEAAITGALRQAGLLAQMSGIYDTRAADQLPGARARKRLDLPLRDNGISNEAAVFVGDSQLDAEAARHHGVPFIRVPRSEDRAFSFERLIDGPSRYRSGEYSAHFDEAFRQSGMKSPS